MPYKFFCCVVLRELKISGDHNGKDTPVPMPNTVVKLTSADGTWGFAPGRVGRRQSYFTKPFGSHPKGFVFFNNSTKVPGTIVELFVYAKRFS